MKNHMKKEQRFGAPDLINALSQSYGSEIQTEEVSFREYPDVEKFLAEKYESQKEAEKFKLVFK